MDSVLYFLPDLFTEAHFRLLKAQDLLFSNLNYPLNIIFALLYGVLVVKFIQSIISPVFYLHKAQFYKPLDYIIFLLANMLVKSIYLLFTLILSASLLPIFFLIEKISAKLFGFTIPINSHQSLVLVHFLSITISILILWLNEFKEIRQGILHKNQLINKKIAELNKKFSLEIPNSLIENTVIFHRDHFTMNAYAYGGFIIKPRIVFPKSMLLPSWERNFASICLHEFSHIRRLDTFVLLSHYSLMRLLHLIANIVVKLQNLLARIPFLGSVFWYLLNAFKTLLLLINSFQVFLSRINEVIADTEAMSSYIPSSLMASLVDMENNYLSYSKKMIFGDHLEPHITKSMSIHSNEDLLPIQNEVIRSLKLETHPSISKRIIWGSTLSSRFYNDFSIGERLQSIRLRWPIYFFGIVTGALLLIFSIDNYQSYSFYNALPKKVLEYEKLLMNNDQLLRQK